MKIYEETNYPTIEQAYEELTREEFAVWIRMMMLPDEILCKGKKHVGKICKYSTNYFYKLMKGLHAKDYITYVKPAILGKPFTIILRKKAMISGVNHFIKLSVSSAIPKLNNDNKNNENA